MVPGQQPLPQHDQDKDDSELQEKEDRAHPHSHQRVVVEQVESVHITNKPTWSKHTKTVVKRARQSLFPLRRLKIFGIAPQILKMFYSCTIKWLHHCLVWQLLVLRPQGTTESIADGPVHHWGQASCHPGPLYQAVSEEGPKIC